MYRQIHKAMKNYLIESAHDISDGGLILALAEKMMGTPMGIKINLDLNEFDLKGFLFNESAGRILVTIKPENEKAFESLLNGFDFTLLGETTITGSLVVKSNKNEILKVSGQECLENYKFQVGDF